MKFEDIRIGKTYYVVFDGDNYAAPYVAVTKDDFVSELERASDYTDFMPLVEEIPTYNTGDDYGYYCGYETRQSLKRILEAQNESLGFDLDTDVLQRRGGDLGYRHAGLLMSVEVRRTIWRGPVRQSTSSPVGRGGRPDRAVS